ncbi:MAG: RNA polymerase sigma factor [Spirochaetes bacterium]|nr:RNA polymerase sigma factor [Spirochaetota bacterium]MBU1080714.1 RNA polymerase sigma factor [Spirochaetota bacterium]
MMISEEQAIVSGAQNHGLSAAHEALWEDARPRLEAYLGSFAGLGAEDVEEILQDVSLVLWRRGAELEPDARAWLYRIARNAAIDALRYRRRRPTAAVSADAGGVEPTSPYPGPEERLLEAERDAFVAAFLAGLSDRDREMLYLRAAEDYSYSRIAALVGLPLGTVKWRMAGLKRSLAARYRKEFG